MIRRTVLVTLVLTFAIATLAVVAQTDESKAQAPEVVPAPEAVEAAFPLVDETAPDAECGSELGDASMLEEMAPGGGGGKGCKDCPKTIGLKCRRISCSPCCYQCPDSEFPLCSS